MHWIATNDKILFEVLEVKDSSFFEDDLGNLRKGRVTSVGEKVNEVLVGSEILLSFQDITYVEKGIGVCSERNIISVGGSPIHNKIEVKLLPQENEFLKMAQGIVVKTALNPTTDIKVGEHISFKLNTFSLLPNNNALLSEDKVFLKIG